MLLDAGGGLFRLRWLDYLTGDGRKRIKGIGDMLSSLARKVSLTLVASVWMSGCGGRSLEPDTAEWYGEGGSGDTGGSGGSEDVRGGATHKTTTSARGGSTTTVKGGSTATGGTQSKSSTVPRGGTGGYKSSNSKGGASGFSGSTPRGGSGGYKSSSSKGGASGYSSSIRGGSGGVGGYSSSMRGGASGAGGSVIVTGGTAASAGTSAVSCPIHTCAKECPFGRWQGLNGCYDCSCAPPSTSLSADIFSCPASSLSLATTASSAILDGLDWWTLTFQWTCTALTTGSGQPLTGTVVAYVRKAPSVLPLEAANRTLYPEDVSKQLWRIPVAQLSAAQEGAPVNLAAGNETFLSIRVENSRFVGGLYLQATVPNTTDVSTVTLSGPFSVEMPVILI